MSLELHHDFTFNPDGSGRVQVRWSGPLDGARSPADFARSEIERARGVDAWADVTCEPDGDRLVFTGTAWFPDVRALRFHCQGFHVSSLDFEVRPQDDGGVVVASVRAPSSPATTTIPTGASDEQALALLAQEREKLAMVRGFIDGMFGGLRCSAVLRLPGTLVEPVRGERVADNAARVQFDGAQLLAILDRLQSDDALMLRIMRQGTFTPDSALELLGEQGPVSLRCEPAGPQFDYTSEVAAAREQFAAFADSLQAAVPVERPAQSLANVRVVATRVVFEADGERDLCPQNQNQPGITLTIAGDLPQQVLELSDASFDRLVLADGTDATPTEEWDRRCHFPKLTKDGRTACVEFDLKHSGDARGVAEFSGRVTAVCAEGSDAWDLGFPELTAGATGTYASAVLHRVEQENERSWTFEVQVQVARARILACEAVAGDARTPLELAGYSCCNDDSTLTYRLEGELTPDARLVMTVASELSRTQFGFSLQHVDWLGRALS